eukprot:scaffold58356_cov21-Tisochrysis_lutea.AAC.1
MAATYAIAVYLRQPSPRTKECQNSVLRAVQCQGSVPAACYAGRTRSSSYRARRGVGRVRVLPACAARKHSKGDGTARN